MSKRVPWLLATFGAAGLFVSAAAFKWRPSADATPTARVKKGDLSVEIHLIGELKPARSAMLLAPSVGGNLQIMSLKASGTRVAAKEVVVEFDPSEQEFNVEQARSELQEAEQQLAKENTDAAIQRAQDRIALLQARFELRKAELDAGRNELLAAIDARRNEIAVEETGRRLAQLEADMKSRATSSRAKAVVLEEKREKARLKMRQAEKAMEEMKITTPVPGFVAVLENRSLDFQQPGMSLPEYRTGDLVSSGQPIAQISQPESMEVIARVDEADRPAVEAGQAVEIRCEGLPPGVVLTGKVKRVASVPARGNFGQTGNKKFDMVVEVTGKDDRLRSGQTAQMTVKARELKGILRLPRQAVFEKDGRSLVYVRAGEAFASHEIKIVHRTESTVVLEGVAEGTEVALADPEASSRGGRRRSADPAGPMAGGAR